MTDLKPPRDLSADERRLFRRVVTDLGDRVHGIPLELITDYVRADTRIRRLQEIADTTADVKICLGAYRQLEAAVTQRRQIAGRLFPDEALGKKAMAKLTAQKGAAGTDWASLLA